MPMNLTDFTILMVEDDPNDILLTQRAFMQASLVNPHHRLLRFPICLGPNPCRPRIST